MNTLYEINKSNTPNTPNTLNTPNMQNTLNTLNTPNTLNNLDELKDYRLNFVNKLGNISLIFDHIKKGYYSMSKLTNWISIKMKLLGSSSKYYSLANMNDGYYIGDIDNSIYYNMRAKLFKLNIKEHWYSQNTNKYIIMIIENPESNKYMQQSLYNESYKIIIYKIFKFGTYVRKLVQVDIYSSKE